MPILTLGHSTHSPERFIEILDAARIDRVLDIRSHPTSHWPWWHLGAMQQWIPASGRELLWLPALGGWDVRHGEYLEWAEARGVNLKPYLRGHFPKQRIAAHRDADPIPDEFASQWTSQGLHDYAWYTAIPEFLNGLDQLVADYGREDQPRVVLVCSELLWWKCHRSMVADVLGAYGVPAQHVTPAPLKSDPLRVKVTPHNASPRLPRYPLGVHLAWANHRTTN